MEDPLQVFARLLMHALQVENTRIHNEEMAKPRYAEHDRLVNYGYRLYSQTDEDGIIAEIFKRIGTTNKRFIEIGTGDGTQCNTTALLVDGWGGLWIEGMPSAFEQIEAKICPKFPRLKLIGCCVDMDNINDLVRAEGEVDLLSVDIDGNDYWVWKAMDAIRPRVVCIEYNALLPPPVSRVTPYDPKWVWDGTNYYGASLKALELLGRRKGYSLVGCCFSGANAFFVRDDLVYKDDVFEWYGTKKPTKIPLFSGPYTAEEHYEPIRFYAALAIGHAACPAPHLYVTENGEVDDKA